MSRVPRIHVTLAPRESTTSLFSAPDLRTALAMVEARPAPGASRLAIWADAPPPTQGPDVVVCVPVTSFEDRRAQAEAVVARWDAVWLLVESMPHEDREVAHQHIVDLISIALLAAAIEGAGETADDADGDVGF